ncbi:unnamed protein product [Dicrocoelium dendriticum]|nr:unnamed protein product [Dicrocoelium dendriticum]
MCVIACKSTQSKSASCLNNISVTSRSPVWADRYERVVKMWSIREFGVFLQTSFLCKGDTKSRGSVYHIFVLLTLLMLPKKSSKPIIINECRTRAPAVKHNVKEGSGVLLRSHRRRHSEKYREEKVIDVLSTSAREQDNTDLEALQKPQCDGTGKEMRSDFCSNYQESLIPTKLDYPLTDPPVSEDESDFTRLQTDFEKHLSFPHGSSDSELENISECGATSGSQRSIREEATCPPTFPADRSKLLKVFLTREEQRLSLLSNLLSEFASMKNVRSTSVTNEVRNILQNLYYIQKAFVKELYVNQEIMADPNAEICSVFHCVVQRQALLSSYQKTVAAMMNKSGPAKPLNSSESEKDPNGAILALRNSLQEPYTWIVQTVEDMKSLSQATTTRNPDHQGFEALYETLMKETIECHSVLPAYGKELSFGTVRKLLLHSLVVELLNWNTDERKLRYLLLFTDVLVCAKVVRKDRHRTGLGGMFRGVRESTRHRNQTRGQMMQPEQPTAKCSSQEQTVRLETKWIIPIESLTLHSNMRVGTDQQREAEQEKKIERLKELISGLRESKEKLKGEEDKVRLRRTKAALSKLEGQLVIQTPQLIIPISEFQNQRHLILLVTERERNHWRTALEKAIQSAGGTRSGPPTKNTVLLKAATISSSDGAFETRSRMGIEQTCPRINSSDMDKILCKYQHLIRFNKTGLALLMGQNSSGRTGILRTEVHGITGLNDIDSECRFLDFDFAQNLETNSVRGNSYLRLCHLKYKSFPNS